MEYLGRTPSPPLDTFIERIWYCADVPPHTQERVLPGGGTLDLVVNLAEDEIRIHDSADPGSVRRHPGAVIAGSRTRSYLYDPRQRASVVGAHFRPGCAFAFLGVSPSEIVDTFVQLDDLWGSLGRNLREQLVEAASPDERLRLVEAVLLARLRVARAGHPAVRVAVAALRAEGSNEARVADVAELVGLSHRRFVEVFEREVGLTPKLFARLERFHRVKQRIATLGAPPCWPTFAIECGYFDQSHMLREFVGFSGMSPASYLRSRSDETQFDHVVHAFPRQPGSFGRRQRR